MDVGTKRRIQAGWQNVPEKQVPAYCPERDGISK
jgi:hypothetical protein